MDDDTRHSFRDVLKMITTINDDILKLRAEVATLMVWVARMTNEGDIKTVVDSIREHAKKAIETMPTSKEVQEERDLFNTLAKHLDDMGKHNA